MRQVPSLVWISGATQGLGLGLARTVPFPDARVINLSRRVHPDIETVRFDLTRPETYAAVAESFTRELAGFQGERAIFIHNAYYQSFGYVSEADPVEYARAIQANAVAPMILGDMFLRAVGPAYESGLVLMSSAGARYPYEGIATYCAAKAAAEMWVRTVRQELAGRGRSTWVVAVRPGFVDTPAARRSAAEPASQCKVAPDMASAFEQGNLALSPDAAGRAIWSGLGGVPDKAVLGFGELVPPN